MPLPDEINYRLTPAIRRHRQGAGLTQMQLAVLAGLGQDQVSRLETGRDLSAVSVVTLVRLAGALRCPIERLFEVERTAIPAE